MVIWLVGLSGAGKTTIGREVCHLWKQYAPGTVLLDGDDLRRITGQDQTQQDYSVDGRRKNAERIVRACDWLNGQDINVVCCVLCIFEDIMRANRVRFTQYFQVGLDCPLEELKRRDTKGLYACFGQGLEKNVVGMDIAFSLPRTSDLTLHTGPGAPSPESLARHILEQAGALP